MQMIDFTHCEPGYKDYGGSDSKRSIDYNGNKYMIKFSDDVVKVNNLQTSTSNSVFSEYIGSHISNSIGIKAHETLLGTYNDEVVVACRDFTTDDFKLQEFGWFMLNIYRRDEIGRIPTYRQIYEVPDKSELLNPIKEAAIDQYWDTFVLDAFIGNFDRHKGNWGFLVNEKTHEIKPAPVYDCGSSLYPGLSEKHMDAILSDREEINKRLFVFPNTAINKNDNPKKIDKFGYYELLSSGLDKNCTAAFERVLPRINMKKVFEIVDDTPFISDTRKHFYKKMLGYRKEFLLDKAYKILKEQERASVTDNLEKKKVMAKESSSNIKTGRTIESER